MSKIWYVYIATNYSNSVLYTGITNDLRRRIWEHKQELDKKSFLTNSSPFKLEKLKNWKNLIVIGDGSHIH